MIDLPWPGPAVVLMQQPDGTVTAFPMDVHTLDFAPFERGAHVRDIHLRMSGVMLEGRTWDPSDRVPFEQAAITSTPQQIQQPTEGASS